MPGDAEGEHEKSESSRDGETRAGGDDQVIEGSRSSRAPRDVALEQTGAARFAYLAIGFLFVGLGGLGAVLPVLPTTPFLLISLWAFSRSSVRFETWLLEHKRFGPRLVAWRTHRVIPIGAKLAAWGSMIASLTIMAVVRRPMWQIALAASVMAIGATYVASKPSRPPAS